MEDSEDTHPGLVGKVAKKIPAIKPLARSRTVGSLFSPFGKGTPISFLSIRFIPYFFFLNAFVMSSCDVLTDLRFLDVHVHENLDEDNSPSAVLEACDDNLDIEANSSKASSLCLPSKPYFKWKKLFKIWKKKSKHFSSKTSVKKICSKVVKRGFNLKINANMCKMKASWKIFSFSELQKATSNFSKENLIGKGGFAEVHKGCLKGGQLVAVKRLTLEEPDERVNSFLSELGIMAHVDHPNTATLIGYGVEGGLFIVMQLSSLGSLRSLLNDSRENMEWRIRYKIALGTADGLMYLHERCQRRIIHRDIKADNILLTEDYEPQICDFGLAKWLPKQWTHHYIFKFEGTFGYFAPEYFMYGIVDEKTDIFAFGVLLLELITGQRAFNTERQSILLWAKPYLDEHDLKNLVDPVLGDDYDAEELDRMVLTAALCTQQAPVLRPRMNQVTVLLKGDDYYPENKNEKQAKNMRRTYSEEIFDAKEYNSTKHLNEMRRHRQIAFGAIE